MDLNKYYISNSSPLANRNVVNGLDFDSNYEIQTKRLRASNIEVENFIRNSTIGTLGANINSGASLNVTFTLSPKVAYRTNQNMALIYAAVYEGTSAVAGSQIYPTVGGAVTGTGFEVRSGYEYDAPHGTNTAHTVSVTNLTGSTRTVYYRANAVYIQERYGESS